MNKYAKYISLIIASSISVGALTSIGGVYDCVMNAHVSNQCEELFLSSIPILLVFSGIASICILLIGLPLFISLRDEGKDTIINVVLLPAIAFSFIIFILFGVYIQKSFFTFAVFSFYWLFTAAAFWYVADRLALTSRSIGTQL